MPKPARLLAVAGLSIGLAACGDRPETDTVPVAAEPQEPAETLALPRSEAPANARVFFITPADGDTVESPVTVEFGIEGMSVVPAGTAEHHSGHHHIVINAELPAFDMPIPANDNYIHFGDGSTSTSLELPPGEHSLQLILGDHVHIPHDPPVYSDVIRITVAGGE